MLACTKIECEVIEENTEIIKRALNREFGIDFSKQGKNGAFIFKLFDFWDSSYDVFCHLDVRSDLRGYYIKIEGDLWRDLDWMWVLIRAAYVYVLMHDAIMMCMGKKSYLEYEDWVVILLLGNFIMFANFFAFLLCRSYVFKKTQKTLDQLSAELCQTNNNKQNCSSTETDVAAYCRFCGAELKQNAAFCSKCGKQTK